jgi:hypothetical protein
LLNIAVSIELKIGRSVASVARSNRSKGGKISSKPATLLAISWQYSWNITSVANSELKKEKLLHLLRLHLLHFPSTIQKAERKKERNIKEYIERKYISSLFFPLLEG